MIREIIGWRARERERQRKKQREKLQKYRV